MASEQTAVYVRRILEGDQNAFGELYSATSKRVYFICINFLKNEHDAKDVMQETYLTAYQKLHSLKDAEKAAGWLEQIAVNKCRDFLKRKAAIPIEDEKLEEILPAEEELVFSEEYITNAEKRQVIMEILRTGLSDLQYQTVILYYFNELSVRDTAKAMECSEGSVKNRLSTARRKIKKSVEEYEKKHETRLYSLAGVPLLTRLLQEEANHLKVPDISGLLISEAAKHTGKAVVKTAGRGGVHMLRGKLIAGAVTAVIAAGGSGAAAVHFLSNSGNQPDTEYQQTAIVETLIETEEFKETKAAISTEALTQTSKETTSATFSETTGTTTYTSSTSTSAVKNQIKTETNKSASSAGTTTAAKTDDKLWKKAYLEVAESYDERPVEAVECQLVYLDNDDVPEFYIGDPFDARWGGLYTYSNGKAVEIMTFGFKDYFEAYTEKSGIFENYYYIQAAGEEAGSSYYLFENGTLTLLDEVSYHVVNNTYKVNGESVSKEQYDKKVAEYQFTNLGVTAHLNTAGLKQDKIYSYDEMIEYLGGKVKQKVTREAVIEGYCGVLESLRNFNDWEAKGFGEGYADRTPSEFEYTLFDMNHDSTPELIVMYGLDIYSSVISFYTFDETGVTYLGDASAYSSAFLYDTEANQFVTVSGHMGIYWYEWFDCANGKINVTKQEDLSIIRDDKAGTEEYYDTEYGDAWEAERHLQPLDMCSYWCGFDSTHIYVYTGSECQSTEYSGFDYTFLENYPF